MQNQTCRKVMAKLAAIAAFGVWLGMTRTSIPIRVMPTGAPWEQPCLQQEAIPLSPAAN